MTPRKTPPTERTLPLDLHGVADLLGLKHSTVKSKRHDGELPLPDARLGNADLWFTDTIDQWNANRPGRGWHGPHD